MTRNPVMLTALVVVHWNERRLPEQRADLYESILTWLARAREKRPRREPAERCLVLLRQLALAMQDHCEGRHVQVSKGWAADELAPQFGHKREEALAFIEQEEVDSGIIVSRGSEVRFWHSIFQEYLAARAIAGKSDSNQYRLLLGSYKIYKMEWREVALLLAGVLCLRQGTEKVNALFKAILDRMGKKATLVEQARCVGLLGAMVRDLQPLKYQPTDHRYPKVLDAVLGIFQNETAAAIEFGIRLDAAEALGQAGDPRLSQDNWITIPASQFWMGAQNEDCLNANYDPEALDSERPLRKVSLAAFRIARYPVTVWEYRRFVEAEGYQDDRWWANGGDGKYMQPKDWGEQILHPNRPVSSVSWHEAEAYCKWAGVRLLSEAEWERAARGSSGRRYPWGNEKPDAMRANYSTGPGHPTPVGLYPTGATPEGIQDLGGNVWEWVADCYVEKYFRNSSSSNSLGPARVDLRVRRGGSYLSVPGILRATLRDTGPPTERHGRIGFRCARDVDA